MRKLITTVFASIVFCVPFFAFADTVYNAIPDPLAPNYPSQPFQAQQTNEFGDYVHLDGVGRTLSSVTVSMSDWARASTAENVTFCAANQSNCDATGFFWPITVNVYNNSTVNDIPTTLLGTKTITAHIPWRPEGDPTCPDTGYGAGFGYKVGDTCYNGYAFNLLLDLSDLNLSLPNDVILGFVYNTQTYGPNPTGVDGPYNSLNIVVPPGNAATVGTDDSHDQTFWNTETVSYYTNNNCAGNTFCKDTNWGDYGTVAMKIDAVTPISNTVLVSGNTSAGENQPGWMFNRDASTATPFEFNNDQASIGTGALYVKPIGANASDKFIAENFINTPLADVHSISYDFRIGNAGLDTQEEQFYMNVYANFGVSDDLKFYDCRYDVVPTIGSKGGFTTVTFDPTKAYPVTKRGTSPFDCPAVPAEMNLLSAGSNIRAFSVSVGDTSISDVGLDGYLDKVVTYIGNTLTTYNFDPAPAPTMVKVQIFKFIDGVMATAVNAANAVFPMLTTFTSPNLGNYTDAPFTLSPSPWGGIGDPYEADFIGSVAGANYTAHEVTSGNEVVGASCADGKPFALAGYSTGDTLALAQAATKTTTAPQFTDLQSDHVMIVWNTKCAVVPPQSVVPTSKEQCMNNGWRTLKDAEVNGKSFKNQGDCVSFVATKGKNKAAGN